MSHFAEMQVEFRQENEAELVAALEERFGQGNVEVHPEGTALIGFEGKSRAEAKGKDFAPPCHIVIRRENVGSSANDVGYRRVLDGYVAYVSDFDKSHNFNKKSRDRVLQEYTLRVSEKQLRAKNYGSIRRVKLDDGSIRLESIKLVR